MRTNNIFECIYTADETTKIYDRSYWGESMDDVNYIDGPDAMQQAKENNIIIGGGSALSSGVGYIFRWNQAHTRLVPYHVTMKLKTIANINNGSCKYGYDSILRDALNC